jgi:hypothetical protein
MFPQLFGMASAQTSFLLVLVEVFLAVLTGDSASRVLHRARRRRERREAAMRHYARSMEEFPELAAR